MEAEIKTVDLESKDLVAERIEQIKALFPEVATEEDASIDFEKLRLILGDEVDEGNERYAFTWPGKADAIRQSQTVSTATLRPCPDESVHWDTTQNLYIEGDNLEVLKLLQRGYHGRVELIYIDPPYNTGHEFVYRDSFGDSVANYKKQAGLTDQSNADTSGSYHSAWCSMMYPRLRLARELLADDGVIFVSIDDREADSLKKICDEIFGNANFVAQIVWQKKYSPQNDALYFSTMHEYLLCYAKKAMTKRGDSGWRRKLLPRTESQNAKYKNPDNDPRGPWKTTDLTSKTKAAGHSYEIVSPSGKVFTPSAGRQWAPAENTFNEWLADNRIWFGEDGSNMPAKKTFLSEVQDGSVPNTIWFREEVGDSQQAIQALDKLMGVRFFDTPKPLAMMLRLIDLVESKDAIVLDFFSGSGTMAHAVMEANAKDNGARQFVMVQLPEKTSGEFETICEAGKERIRRAGALIAAEVEESNRQLKLGEEPRPVPDIGFRVLKLDESGIARPEPGQLMLDRIKEGRTDKDIIFEMMLKWGLELTYPIEKIEVNGYSCYSVAGDALICCMQDGLTVETIQAIADMAPDRVFMLDSILTDTLKLNAV